MECVLDATNKFKIHSLGLVTLKKKSGKITNVTYALTTLFIKIKHICFPTRHFWHEQNLSVITDLKALVKLTLLRLVKNYPRVCFKH